MNNQNRRTNFTSSDDELIRQQPLTGIGLKTLEALLRTSRDALMHRAEEPGLAMVTSNDRDRAIDSLRCTDRFIDPLLERLKKVHGAGKYQAAGRRQTGLESCCRKHPDLVSIGRVAKPG